MERNVISKNTTIIGDIKAEGDFRIDGVLEGSLKTKGRVILGADGSIKGNIEASNADIEGIFSGQLKVEKTLTVKTIATISGEVTVGKLSIEPGAHQSSKHTCYTFPFLDRRKRSLCCFERGWCSMILCKISFTASRGPGRQ